MSRIEIKINYNDMPEAGHEPFWKQGAADRHSRGKYANNGAAAVNPGLSAHTKKSAQKNGSFLQALKTTANFTRTENGAKTLRSSGSDVVDLFACVGALRHMNDADVLRRFYPAWAEDRDLAMKILFYARDVRGGLGERNVARTILRSLAEQEPDSVRKNIALIPFYGRYDDLLELLGTPCEEDVLAFIREELAKDTAALAAGEKVSLLAKWLPSVNASSEETRRRAVTVARGIGMSDSQYRRTLSSLRSAAMILENRLREKDYTFSYAAQPSKAMFKYRSAFLKNDGTRYLEYMQKVSEGKEALHTGTLMPYELVRKAKEVTADDQNRKILDVTWNALPDFTDGRNALAVVDVSGSMFGICAGADGPRPIDIAVSLGLYFAERNSGPFRNHFITFSEEPTLIEVKGADLTDKVVYIQRAPWGMNTDIEAVFELILKTAVSNELPQSELPETVYIISDMEFDSCVWNSDVTNFEYAKGIFEAHGYRLPKLVFWNVQSRNKQVPVRMDERGVALVSGCSARIFSMVMEDELDPYKFMMKVIGSERYAPVRA